MHSSGMSSRPTCVTTSYITLHLYVYLETWMEERPYSDSFFILRKSLSKWLFCCGYEFALKTRFWQIIIVTKGWFTIWRKVLRLALRRDASAYARIGFWSILALRCVSLQHVYSRTALRNATQRNARPCVVLWTSLKGVFPFTSSIIMYVCASPFVHPFSLCLSLSPPSVQTVQVLSSS